MSNLAQAIDKAAVIANNGPWIAASGGTEQPFTSRCGRRLLYCWQPTTGRHAYLDLDSDIFLTDEEAARIL